MNLQLHRLFFYLTVLFLPTQLAYHFWPEWALILGRKVDYLSPAIYLTDTFIVATILSWWYESYSKLNPLTRGQNSIRWLADKTRNYWMILILIIFVFTNIFLSMNQFVAMSKWLKVLEYGLLGWYIRKTKPAVQQVIVCLSIAVFYTSILSLIQFILQHSVNGFFWWFGERTFNSETPGIARFNLCLPDNSCRELLRSYGTLPHPNVLGGFLALTLPLILQKRSYFRQSWYLYLTCLLGFLTLLFTFSRTAWIAAALGFTLSIRRGFVVGLFLLCLALLALPSTTSESYFVRNDLTRASIAMWKSSPVVGVGLGNFLIALPEYLVEHSVYFLQPVHNIYLLILSELGVVGVVVVCILVFMFKKQRIFTIHYSLFTILLLGLFDHYLLTLQQGQLLLVLILALAPFL